MMHLDPAPQAVELSDELTTELQAGAAYAAAFYAADGRRSLVASISDDDLAKWDGYEERSIVSDPDGVDLPDEVDHDQAA